MDALEYMKRQLSKHRLNKALAIQHPNTPEKQIEDIEIKIGYYIEAVKALESVKHE